MDFLALALELGKRGSNSHFALVKRKLFLFGLVLSAAGYIGVLAILALKKMSLGFLNGQFTWI